MLGFAVFIFGIVIGSFLNVCIYRLPNNESVVSPPSHCPACGASLKVIDLIPIISYLLLRGRCRYCGQAYSARYALIELLTGLVFWGCYMVVGLGPVLVKTLIMTAFLVVITFIDFDHQLILDKVLLWFAGFAPFINLALQFTAGWSPVASGMIGIVPAGFTGWLDMVIAALVGGGVMLILAFISRGGMGGGDIKFAAVLGLWFGWKLTLLTLILSFIIGGIGGGGLLLLKLKGRKDFIPFGPFIALGAYVVMLFGWRILAWYLGG